MRLAGRASSWRVALWLIVLPVCAVAGWLALPAMRKPVQEGAQGPVLVLGEAPGPLENDTLALDLALASIPAPDRSALLARFETLSESIEASANPFVEDLTESPLAEMQDKVLPRLLPLWTASRTLAAGAWATPDRTLTVRVADACPEPAEGRRCVSANGNEQDSIARRARFLAWPITYGLRIKVDDATRHATVDALEARVLAPESNIALVVDGQPATSEARVRMAELAKRIERPVCRSGSKFCAFLHVAAVTVRPTRRLGFSISANEVFVVPRLGGLARQDAFREEVRALQPQ